MIARHLARSGLFTLATVGACSGGGDLDDGGAPQTSAGTTADPPTGTSTPTEAGDTVDTTASTTAVTGTSTADPTADPTTDTGTTGEPDPGLPVGRVEIGFWCGLPAAEQTPARYEEIAAAGFTFVSNACDGTTYVPEYNNAMLALADAVGMTAIVSDARALAAASGADLETNLDAVVADYGAAPGLRGYHLSDEPSTGQFGTLAAAVGGLLARDPTHPGIINLLPDYASLAQLGAPSYDAYIGAFIDQVHTAELSYDHYNFLLGGADGPSFFANLAVVRAHSVASAVPFGQYIQAISYNGHRATTGPEKRWAALHTLAYGGTAVMYFTYWTPPQTQENFGDGIIGANGLPTAQYADVTEINRTMRALGRYLGAATSTAVFHNGPLDAGTGPRPPAAPVYIPSPAPITVGLFSIGDDAYALLVNRNYLATTDSDVYLSAASTPAMMDPATGELVPVAGMQDDKGTKVHVSLPPGDGLLFHLPGPVPAGPPGAEAYVGNVRADAGTLDVVDASFGAALLRGAGWDDCPAGTTHVGKDFQANGFWLCARDDLAARVFHVGTVVNDAGTLFKVQAGTVTPEGPAGWDTCPTGTMLGRRFESNGFWLCME